MQSIQSMDQYFTVVRDQKPVVMIFSANWCSDCRYLDVFIDDVANAYAEKMDFYKVDRDQFPELCETLDIMGIPSFVAYNAGEVISRFVNGKRKTRAEVEDYLNDVLEKVNA